MRHRPVCLMLILMLAAAGFAQKTSSPKSDVSQLIVNARFIYVTAVRGDQFNPQVLPEDRQAVAALDEALRKWGRYNVVNRPEDADITLLVRRGDVTGSKGGIGGRRGVGIGGYEGVEAGNPDDMLMVVRGGENPLDAPSLWRRSRRNGLQSPALTLFQEFKKQVEQAAASQKKP